MELSKVTLMLEDEAKFVPVIVIERLTIPEVGVRLIDGICIVKDKDPEWLPVATVPVTVIVNAPPGVWLDVSTVKGELVGLPTLVGNEMGLARFTVVLAGAPEEERRMVAGSPVVVELGRSDTLTV